MEIHLSKINPLTQCFSSMAVLMVFNEQFEVEKYLKSRENNSAKTNCALERIEQNKK